MSLSYKGSDKQFSFWVGGKIVKRNLDFISARSWAIKYGGRGFAFVCVKHLKGTVHFEMRHGKITLDSPILRKY